MYDLGKLDLPAVWIFCSVFKGLLDTSCLKPRFLYPSENS